MLYLDLAKQLCHVISSIEHSEQNIEIPRKPPVSYFCTQQLKSQPTESQENIREFKY